MGQKNFTKWLRSEVGVAFGIGVAVAGCIMFIVDKTYPLQTNIALLQQQLSEIKNNDLTHSELEITSINQELKDFQSVQITQGQQITEILTILKK